MRLSSFVVGVAQLVVRQIVVLDVVGSSPTAHPKSFICRYSGTCLPDPLPSNAPVLTSPPVSAQSTRTSNENLRSSDLPRRRVHRRHELDFRLTSLVAKQTMLFDPSARNLESCPKA